MAAALLAGSVIGPPLVQAATAGLVTIQGSGTTNQAKVTKAGQLETAGIDPGSTVVIIGAANCAAGGIYTVPAGKALIITSVNFYNHPLTSGQEIEMDLLAGPAAAPCGSLLAAGTDDANDLTLNQAFPSGIAVPAGSALGTESANDEGTLNVYGYLVPKTDVPPGALRQLPRARDDGSATTRLHR